MQFKFDANQEYQLQAIESIVSLFEGQQRIEAEVLFSPGSGLGAVANRLDLEEAELITNLKAVQKANNIELDAELKCIDDTIETGTGQKLARFPNFSIEMETGTGKTYVYL